MIKLSLFFIIISIFLVGVVCASDYTDDSKTINTPQLEQKDTCNIEVYNTKNDYTDTNEDVKKSVKETTKNNTELTDKKTLEKDMLSQDDLKNAVKSSTLTVDSAKNVYVGNQMSIYGKLSADGLNIPYESVTVKVDGKKYNVTTSKYGKYNIKITPTSSGNKTIIATFYGSDKYGAATISTTFQANKKSTLITLGCTKNVTVGDTVKIYGKLTDQNGKNLANQTVKVKVNGKTYTLTTTKYGNYYLNVTATITGKNNITSTYTGTKAYSSNSNKTYFKANKKTTTITINSTKNVYVGNVVKILGKLTDQNGKYIANQNIDLYIDNEHYNITTTKYGNYYYNYTTKTAGTHTITVKYTGTNNYTGSKNTTYFNATKKTGQITLVTTKNVYVGGTVKIYGKVTANNKYVPYHEVTITVDGKKYNLTTSKYGNYNMNFTATSEGYKKITASYAGTDAITGNTNSTYFNATKKGTTITLVSTKSVTVGNIVKICGKLTDQNGKYIANQRIDLYIDNEHYNITTTKYGNYYYNYTTKTAGTHSITVKYYGTNIYTNSTNTTYFNVAKKTTSITVGSTANVYVGNSIFIYGTLKSNGQNLAYKTVKINADDKTYYVTTSQYGYYSIYVSASSTGNKIITATFNADDYYYGSSSITTTNVIKKDTKITLDPIETKEYLSVLRLTGKLTDNNGNNLNSMNVNFNINGRKYTVTTDNYGEFALNYQTRDVGQNNITVSYSGNNIYTATSIMKTFMVTSKTTKIEVFTDNYVQYLDYISIGGYYEDWDGNPLTYTTLSVNVNGQQFYTKTGEYGYYSMEYKTNKVGTNNVTVSYAGNTKYKGTSTSTTFTVTPKDTQITIDIEDYSLETNGNYEYNCIVTGKFTDSSGNPLTYTPLSVEENGKKYTTTTDNYGEYYFTIRINDEYRDPIIVSYGGNARYYGASARWYMNKIITEIDAEINGNTIVGETVNIKGNVHNKFTYLQLYVNVNIDINGEKYTVKPDDEGYFNLNYKLNKIGVNNLTVTYEGNNRFGVSIKTIRFIVEGIPTHLTVSNTVKQSNGEYITIKGQLYDLRGNMISYAPLTLTIDGQKYTTTTDNLGSYTYSYKGNPNNTQVLTVNYAGNTKYDKAQTQITFKAQENENTIEILIPHTIEYYYDDYGESWLYTENYEDISIMDAVHLGSDTIIGTTQYLEGQFMAGSRLMQNGIVIEIAPANTMIKAEFYFKNRYGDIKIVTEYSTYVDNCIDTELISGYIPYKAVLTYRQKSPSEIKEWYEYNDEYYVAQY